MNRTLQLSPSSMIKTGIWEDEEFVDSHSIEDRFMTLYLLTCPFRNISGIVKANYRIMTSHLGWDKQQTQIVINRLQKTGDILVDGVYIWLKSYFDHNSLPAPSHFNQINSRLQEIPEEMLKVWLIDALERGVDVDKLYQGALKSSPKSFETPCAHPDSTLDAPCDHPSDRVAPNYNNNDNGNNKDNNNDNNDVINNKSSSGLIYPKLLDKRLLSEISRLLSGNDNAQYILDELASGLERGIVKEPVGWVAKLSKTTLGRTLGGLKKEELRKCV